MRNYFKTLPDFYTAKTVYAIVGMFVIIALTTTLLNSYRVNTRDEVISAMVEQNWQKFEDMKKLQTKIDQLEKEKVALIARDQELQKKYETLVNMFEYGKKETSQLKVQNQRLAQNNKTLEEQIYESRGIWAKLKDWWNS
jgi:biopolymer transport protein ExbB/TolQ